MAAKNDWGNVARLRKGDEVKFVIANREDYEWSKRVMVEHGIADRCDVLMSAVFHELEPVQLVEWILEDRLNVRFQIQLHKIVWNPETRGV